MYSLLSDVILRFIEPEIYYTRKRYAFGTILAASIGAFGLMQTQWFVSLLPRPTMLQIRNHISGSRKRQLEIANSRQGFRAPKGVTFHELFNTDQLQRLRESQKFLGAYKDLQSELKAKFAVSLLEADVVVVPAWKMETQDNDGIIGITDDEGWKAAAAGKGETDVGGFTIRDSDDGKPPKTLDGTPRVALNPNAFESTATLHLVMFHEMLHAMNIPGYSPCRLTFAQNDLTYLPEYRSFVGRAGLGGWREFLIWTLAVAGPWLTAFLIGCLLVKCQRSILRDRNAQSLLAGPADVVSPEEV